MQDRPPVAQGSRRFDPVVAAAAVFFVLAVGFAAAPVVNAGPATLAGMLLLLGIAGVALLGLIAFRPMMSPERDGEAGDPEVMVGALSEPAAVAQPDGRILARNAGWREALGEAPRLPKTNGAAASLFAALAEARKGKPAEAEFKVDGRGRTFSVAALGEGRFLVRLAPDAAPLRLTASPDAMADDAALDLPPPPTGLDAFAAASPFGAALLDGEDLREGVIVEANGALTAMAGAAAAPGARFFDLIAPDSREDALRRLADGKPGPVEVKVAGEGARIGHLYLGRVGGRAVVYLVDVTEQKQIELQLAQSQKMQAIGQLAGGVAHDFNNLLAAIQLRLDELLHRHPLGDPSYDGLNEIRQISLRAADLVRKLLAFSRKATVQRESVDLGELIGEADVLLRRLLREDVRLETEYGRDLPHVRVDKGQIETAIMNLAVNARDAVRMNGGGLVKIRTARVTQAEARALGYAGDVTGELAMIEVKDNGPGMSAEVKDRIFDPFFTTKPLGQGTGLGLATVYGIVKQSDGWIAVDSAPGEGAAFRIFLPVHVPPVIHEVPRLEAQAKPAARDYAGSGRILFVEDEEAVRGIAARLLRARGYEVIEASDGEEALILAEENAGRIDLMISDVVMPGLDGPGLLKQARAYLGTAPVVFISGYAEAEFSDVLEGETGVSFLAKPLDIKSLAERVKQELQAAA